MSILQSIAHSGGQLAVLVDPDKAGQAHLEQLAAYANEGLIGQFLVGGSLIFNGAVGETIRFLKAHSPVPVTLFPGSPSQVCSDADALLLLSLISGRNADLLIGRHVEAAPALKRSGLEIIPTGYLLIDGGTPTSVSYMSNTQPLPAGKPELAVATAMAGEMLGLKCLYLEAGSGAKQSVPLETVQAVCANVEIPVIVGGGIRDAQAAFERCKAGAKMIVVGTATEKQPQLIPEIAAAINEAKSLKIL